jgi:hypothetical protein
MGASVTSLSFYGLFHSGNGYIVSGDILAQIIISSATFVCSMGSAMFIAGMKWGRVNTQVDSINQRLAKIEGMFTLTLKDGDRG